MTNRIENHLPEPDPEKNEGSEPDLSKGKLPKVPGENNDMPNASRSEAAKAPDAASGLEAELRATLEAITGRQIAAEQLGVRHTMSQNEIEVLVRAATAVRAAVDQNTAPPVDAELIRRAAWDQLPPAMAEMVVDLGLRFKTWSAAMLSELNRRAAIENAAESN